MHDLSFEKHYEFRYFFKVFISFGLLLSAISISQAATQNVPIHISGSFSMTPTICHISDNTVASHRSLSVSHSNRIGEETAPHKIALNIDCNATVNAKLSFNAAPTANSNTLFQTSSHAFGVKLSWQGAPILPNKSVDITMIKNQKSYYIDATIIRVAPNGTGDYGEHSFNIAGNLAVDYP
ncbi:MULTISPECIES: fimbrial protein [Providencia]|nr:MULTISPECIES: fimbrial protein [Providencia]ELR5248347.1 hypothetical protein [Providencia rettgeri]